MNETEIITMYKDGYSPSEIAKKNNTYTQKIRRILKKHKVKLRNKSEAQKLALEKGRSAHPTKGRTRTHEEKLAISKGLMDNWASISETERERRRTQSQEIWDRMTDSEKEEMRKLAAAKIREAAKEGSKLELEVQAMLSRNGFHFEAHKKDLIPAQKLEIDIFVPEARTIIEVDGLSHYEPIWGEEHLQKQIKFDMQKDGVVLSKGFNVIRIANLGDSLALARLKDLETELIDVIKTIIKEKATSELKVIKYE